MLWLYSCVILAVAVFTTAEEADKQRQILIYGGNGLLGAPTVERFLAAGDNVTLVSRGNWYWDTEEKLSPHVSRITCDRTAQSDDVCPELKAFLHSRAEMLDVVVDFSAFSGNETRDSAALLQGKSKLYVLISTDSVYDVCNKHHDGPTKESDSHRSEEKEDRDRLNYVHVYGDNKLQAEEELIAFRQHNENSVPYVILRLPDVIGPRDTSYRWWLYQLWVKLAVEMKTHPVTVPDFLEDYPLSLVYSRDVAQLIYNISIMDPQLVNDEVFNVADNQTYTLRRMIQLLQTALDIDDQDITVEHNRSRTLYLYPTVRRGPIDVSKAMAVLDWSPTSLEKVVAETVAFYEDAMTSDRYNTQRNEIIQILNHQLFHENTNVFYDAVETIYGISLSHFIRHDEF